MPVTFAAVGKRGTRHERSNPGASKQVDLKGECSAPSPLDPNTLNHDPLNAILYYCTVLYFTILYSTLLYSTLLYSTLLYYTILYYTILYYSILSLRTATDLLVLCVPHSLLQASKAGAGKVCNASNMRASVRRTVSILCHVELYP